MWAVIAAPLANAVDKVMCFNNIADRTLVIISAVVGKVMHLKIPAGAACRRAVVAAGAWTRFITITANAVTPVMKAVAA